MKTNLEGIELIKRWEGLKLAAYLCPAKVWTIGYGHTTAAGVPAVTKGMKITADDAAEILVRDLVAYEAAVMNVLRRNPNENQFSAMVSLCYNIGPGAFARSSVVKKFNAGDLPGAAAAFRLWNKGGGKVLPGLVRRREEEIILFTKPVTANAAPVVIKTTPEPMDTIREPESVIPETASRRSFWERVTALFRR